MMGARQKLNQIHGLGALMFAAFVGLAWESWGAFVIVAAILIAGAMMSGDIRL